MKLHRSTIVMMALSGTFALGAPAFAAPGYIPFMTTFRKMTANAETAVRAKLVDVVEVPVSGPNADVLLYRQNNDNDDVRRDAILEVTKVLSDASGRDIVQGPLQVVSLAQQSLNQYPESLRAGEEAIIFLTVRHDGNLGFKNDQRGVIARENMGESSIDQVESLLQSVYGTQAEYGRDTKRLNAEMQNLLLKAFKNDGSRLSVDIAIEFGWNFDEFSSSFDESEKAQLLGFLRDSEPGSVSRRELLTAAGRVLPAGGEELIVDQIVNDGSSSVIALGSWALEMYGRVGGAQRMLDSYASLAENNHAGHARLIAALGLFRPKDASGERDNRERFTDILHTTLTTTSDAAVLTESLIAARDMRYRHNELGAELERLVEDFRAQKITDTVFRRVVIALAATRDEAALRSLRSLKGEFNGAIDKHIELAIEQPFTVLVDGR